MAHIEVTLPDGQVQRFDLNKALMTVGRVPSADICITEPPISRLHARFVKEKGRWTVVDLDSRNHVYIGDLPVKSHTLENGDEIGFGSIRAIFCDGSGTPAKKKTASIAAIEEDHCPSCSEPLADGAKFCVNCGYNLATGERVKTTMEEDNAAAAIVANGVAAKPSGLRRSGRSASPGSNDTAATEAPIKRPKSTLGPKAPVSITMDRWLRWILPAALLGVYVLTLIGMTANTAKQQRLLNDAIARDIATKTHQQQQDIKRAKAEGKPIDETMLPPITSDLGDTHDPTTVAIANAGGMAVSLIFSTIVMLIAMAIAAKLGEFGFNSFGQSILQVLAMCGTISLVYAIAPSTPGIVEFFINAADNPALAHQDDTDQGYGYCVFGKVVDGLDVLKKINWKVTKPRGGFDELPVDEVEIVSVQRFD